MIFKNIENYFSFSNKFYKQESGLPMGNPISSSLANLFICFFGTKIIKDFHYMYKTWYLYVDEILAVIPNRHIKDALTFLNIDNSIRLTLETEIDGHGNSSDMTDIHSNQLNFHQYPMI